nr:hypothetical protein [Tanacetum cinerariifolium]
MATTIEQQTTLDESLFPNMQRLRIGRCNFRLPSDIQSKEATLQRLRIGRSNFRLPSDIQSKEATLQVVYDVLRNSPLFRSFQVTTDVPEIYMHEFWATAKLHHNTIRFKIDTRKSVLDLEAFREMLHISPRIPNQPFADLPTEEEVLDFLRFLGHSHDIRYLTDVNVNKLYQPWRSFASVINKCLIHWHYVRDDALFSTIKVVSRHQATQQYGAILPIELTTAKIRNSKAYQEYYACAVGEAAPKPKASARKKKEEELSWKSSDDEDVGSHEEGKISDESNDDSDEGSDNDSDETLKSGAGKDGDEDDDDRLP